jgi:hypothetical protein
MTCPTCEGTGLIGSFEVGRFVDRLCPDCRGSGDAASSIKVYATKTKTTRVIPISPDFLERLKAMREKARTGYP